MEPVGLTPITSISRLTDHLPTAPILNRRALVRGLGGLAALGLGLGLRRPSAAACETVTIDLGLDAVMMPATQFLTEHVYTLRVTNQAPLFRQFMVETDSGEVIATLPTLGYRQTLHLPVLFSAPGKHRLTCVQQSSYLTPLRRLTVEIDVTD